MSVTSSKLLARSIVADEPILAPAFIKKLLCPLLTVVFTALWQGKSCKKSYV
jgi:hypothetical protein